MLPYRPICSKMFIHLFVHLFSRFFCFTAYMIFGINNSATIINPHMFNQLIPICPDTNIAVGPSALPIIPMLLFMSTPFSCCSACAYAGFLWRTVSLADQPALTLAFSGDNMAPSETNTSDFAFGLPIAGFLWRTVSLADQPALTLAFSGDNMFQRYYLFPTRHPYFNLIFL